MKNIEKYIVVSLFAALVLLCFLQIIFRSVLNLSLSWTEELGRYVFILLVYMAACAAVLKDAHVKVEIIDSFVSEKNRKHLETAMDLVFCAFMALIGYYGMLISIDAFELELLSPAMQVPMGIVYAIIPVSFFLMCIRLIQKVSLRYKKVDPVAVSEEKS
ncbi:MAG: TRAP transporter small permease [Lentisphaeraceae bacterium]|nr:TRAP transporter small permease [Lentisphaeraceae bacterium]